MNILKLWVLQVRVNKIYKSTFVGRDMKNILINWKTTLAAVVGILTLVGASTGVLNPVQVAAINALANAFGFLSAKDANVTGGTTKQPNS